MIAARQQHTLHIQHSAIHFICNQEGGYFNPNTIMVMNILYRTPQLLTVALIRINQNESTQLTWSPTLLWPSLPFTVSLYLCVLSPFTEQFLSRPESLRCGAVLFIRGDIMLLFLVRSCSLVLHCAGLGFSSPWLYGMLPVVCKIHYQCCYSYNKTAHTYKHAHRKHSVSPETQPTLQVPSTLAQHFYLP